MEYSSYAVKMNAFIRQRQALLSKYWHLLQLSPDNELPVTQDTLQKFCQSLIDYTSVGHFQIYEMLLSRSSYRKQDIEKALAKLFSTTDKIVEFNDAFESTQGFPEHFARKEWLSGLGEALAHRFEIEDWLIKSTKVPSSI